MLFSIFINNTDKEKIFAFEIFQWHETESHNQSVPQEDIKILRSEIREMWWNVYKKSLSGKIRGREGLVRFSWFMFFAKE